MPQMMPLWWFIHILLTNFYMTLFIASLHSMNTLTMKFSKMLNKTKNLNKFKW